MAALLALSPQLCLHDLSLLLYTQFPGGCRRLTYSLLDVVPAYHVVLAYAVMVLKKDLQGGFTLPLTATPNIKEHKWMHFWVLHHTWSPQSLWAFVAFPGIFSLFLLVFPHCL